MLAWQNAAHDLPPRGHQRFAGMEELQVDRR
jgi:hypothetical protein